MLKNVVQPSKRFHGLVSLVSGSLAIGTPLFLFKFLVAQKKAFFMKVFWPLKSVLQFAYGIGGLVLASPLLNFCSKVIKY